MEYRKNSGQLPLSKGKINYEVFGGNKSFTPIIVCHVPTVSFQYMHLFKDLAHEHPVYFFSPGERDSLLDYAHVLKEVVQAFHLPAPHLISHSYASAYCLIHALEYPVSSLTFLSPVLSTKLWQRDMEVYGKEECSTLLQKNLPKSLKRKKADFLNIPFDFNFMNHIERVNVPTYISVGQFDLVSPSTASAIHNKIEHSHLEIFSNSSHTHFLEAKADFTHSYFHWLKSIEGQSRAIPQIMNL